MFTLPRSVGSHGGAGARVTDEMFSAAANLWTSRSRKDFEKGRIFPSLGASATFRPPLRRPCQSSLARN
jgi:hypothetical protein